MKLSHYMKLSVKDVLINAKALIQTPDHWMKGDYVRWDPKAGSYCFCAMGAIEKASNHTTHYGAAWTTLAKVVGVDRVTDWNDDPKTRHEHVIAAFDAAIEECK